MVLMFDLVDREGWTPLQTASCNGRDSVVESLLKNGANVNQANNYGQTPLYVACEWGHDAVVAQLLQRGADMSLSYKGKRPIDIAREKGNTRSFNLLKAEEPNSVKPPQKTDIFKDVGPLCREKRVSGAE